MGELFGDRVALEATRREYVERAPSPAAYVELFADTFGPLVGLRAALGPEGVAALDQDLLAFATEEDRGPSGGPAEYHYEYLLAVARRC